jgi:hypothetical protein
MYLLGEHFRAHFDRLLYSPRAAISSAFSLGARDTQKASLKFPSMVISCSTLYMKIHINSQQFGGRVAHFPLLKMRVQTKGVSRGRRNEGGPGAPLCDKLLPHKKNVILRRACLDK